MESYFLKRDHSCRIREQCCHFKKPTLIGFKSTASSQIKQNNIQTEIWKINITVNYPCFPHARIALTLAYSCRHQSGSRHNTLWRKPSPCKPTSLPMSGTDLGQSWLMCPQLPRGFWSGGSSACSLPMNTDAEYYSISLLYSKLNGLIRITARQCE